VPREHVYAQLVTVPDGEGTGTRRVQLRVVLTWTRDHPTVYLDLDGWDHDAAEAVDLGGPHLELDWPAANRLIRKFKVARDQSCGTPE
jgi:hypothetical protein